MAATSSPWPTAAFAFACNSYNQNTVAQHCSVTYLRPGFRIGDRLIASERARGLASSAAAASTTSSMTNQDSEHVAEFRGHSRTVKGTPHTGRSRAERSGRFKTMRRNPWKIFRPRTGRSGRRSRRPRATRSRSAAAPTAEDGRSKHAYRELAASIGSEVRSRPDVHPEDLRTLKDLARFPFTVKQDLRDTYPFGMFAVPQDKLVAHPRLLRHHRQADRGRLHPEADIDHVGEPASPARSGRQAGGPATCCHNRLWLRPVHRRARRPLRRREDSAAP
jgi:hypothetical protein